MCQRGVSDYVKYKYKYKLSIFTSTLFSRAKYVLDNFMESGDFSAI